MSAGTPVRLRRVAGEFTVIVLGVLVALFMESAWEDRQERQLAEEYLDRLREETRLNRDEFALDVGFNAVNCRAAGDAFTGLHEDSPAPSEDLLRSIRVTALNRTPRYRRTTCEDLVASGRIGIIREAAVRDRISGLPEIRRQPAQRTHEICNFDRFLGEADSILAGLEEALGATP